MTHTVLTALEALTIAVASLTGAVFVSALLARCDPKCSALIRSSQPRYSFERSCPDQVCCWDYYWPGPLRPARTALDYKVRDVGDVWYRWVVARPFTEVHAEFVTRAL